MRPSYLFGGQSLVYISSVTWAHPFQGSGRRAASTFWSECCPCFLLFKKITTQLFYSPLGECRLYSACRFQLDKGLEIVCFMCLASIDSFSGRGVISHLFWVEQRLLPDWLIQGKLNIRLWIFIISLQRKRLTTVSENVTIYRHFPWLEGSRSNEVLRYFSTYHSNTALDPQLTKCSPKSCKDLHNCLIVPSS